MSEPEKITSLCPLKFNWTSALNRSCEEGDCQWWIEKGEYSRCAIPKLVEYLRAVEIDLSPEVKYP